MKIKDDIDITVEDMDTPAELKECRMCKSKNIRYQRCVLPDKSLILEIRCEGCKYRNVMTITCSQNKEKEAEKKLFESWNKLAGL